MFFEDRFHAAELLADQLEKYKDSKNTIILAIPRGALQMGYVLAKRLSLPLDVVLTKKISPPNNPELAVASTNRNGDIVILNENFKSPEWQEYIKKQAEILQERLEKKFLQYHPDGVCLDWKGKQVLVIDDGVATGNTLIAALQMIKKINPSKIVVALPVGPPSTIDLIKEYADEVVCIYEPEAFMAIGQFFRNFEQVDDEQAIQLLNEANKQ